MKKLRYIAYVRKSTEDEEKQVLSLEAQKNKIREMFKDLLIVDVLEESKSAFEPNKRPVFQHIVNMLDAGEIDGIVAWHPDRLSRNEVDASTITWRIRQGIIKNLKFASFSFDNSPEGLMMLQMTMSQSQYFSAKLSKDVKRGNEAKRKKGGLTGLAPEGYINNRVDKTIKIDPERFPLIRQAFDMYLTGENGVQTVLRFLNDTCKYKNKRGGSISRTTLYHIFSNVRYAGWIPETYDSEIYYKADFPAMITIQEYDQVQLLLGRKGKPKLTARKQFALRGLVHCGECGCAITAEDKVRTYKSSKTKAYIYYHCTRKRPCSQKNFISQDKLYDQVNNLLDSYELIPELYEWGMQALKEMADNEITQRNTIQALHSGAITKVQNKLDKLLDMATSGLIDDKTYINKSEALKAELKAFHEEQGDTAYRVENWYSFTAKTIETLTNANSKFVSGDLADKKDILLAIGQNPLLLDGKLTITPNEWMVPIGNVAKQLRVDIEKVRTLPQQGRNDALEAIRLKWYTR